MNKLKVLVCDDDKAIVNAVSIYLEQENYQVYKAYDGIELLDVLKDKEVHLIIVDQMMPRMDGLSALIEIRKTRNIPVIILSAKSEDTDKIIGLNFGADDYITKPFNPLELMARVKSQTRRYMDFGSIKAKSSSVTGGLELDVETRMVLVDGESKEFTRTEFKILELLMNNLGRVLPSELIYEKVWNEVSYSVDNTIAVHIRRIREKIEINPKEPKYLKVVWGVGYKIEKY